MNDWIGRTLSKVQIEQRLSRGGMAEVYLGRHTTLDRPVAVKILHAHLQEDEDLKRRFMAEAKAVAGLRHPNIVQVYDFDILDDRPYIVMELLQGLSLADYLTGLHASGLSLPLQTICNLVDGIASALDYAHRKGIVHRDIKPGNIMLRQGETPINPQLPLLPNVQPILMDFGVARLTTAKTQTATGTVLGTPAYMSPEQIRGVRIDARSDIYSLAIVVYELLSGKPPFNHDTTPAAVLVKHLQETPPALAGTSPEIQAVTNHALAKDPADRYSHAGEFARDLRDASGQEAPVEAAPLFDATSERGLSRRGRWALLGLAGLFLLAVIGGLGFFGLRQVPALLPASAQPTITMAPSSIPPTATAQPTPVPSPSPAPAVFTSVGTALLRDNSLTLQLQGVSEQPGFAYHVWLIPLDEGALDLGIAQVSEGQLTFSHQAERSLVTQFGQLMVSLEPDPDPNPTTTGEVLYVGELRQETSSLLSHLLQVNGQGQLANIVTSNIDQQSVHFTSHLGFALQSIEGGNLPGAKQHSEHVINIVEGSQGEDYGDWNDDGRAENPGDDFGLMHYLELLDILLSGSPATPPSDLEGLRADVEILMTAAGNARDLATRVASADTLEETELLAEELGAQQIRPTIEALLVKLEGLDLVLAVPLRASDG